MFLSEATRKDTEPVWWKRHLAVLVHNKVAKPLHSREASASLPPLVFRHGCCGLFFALAARGPVRGSKSWNHRSATRNAAHTPPPMKVRFNAHKSRGGPAAEGSRRGKTRYGVADHRPEGRLVHGQW
jgi:hypothetical protein